MSMMCQNMVSKIRKCGMKPETTAETLKVCDRSFFPILAILLQTFGTILVTTSTAEKSFSTLNRSENYLRSSMGETKLGFQLMRDDEIVVQVRKPNSDDDIRESDEDEVIETSEISNFDAFKCFSKGLMWLKQRTDSDSTELMLLKELQDRAANRRQSGLWQS
ncbi:hypothetical protein AVEN_144096-1 [Araneus ventricosus]|uniref:HAT C-terminal dimerisation domain-containing protein n=1 Tax=Araneus ventricosus TaxID=182803 RepID=A0A4Y2QXW0_ARAVE|nr:hypothetical protein AVEN_144096-1 [Araneus ventricosus]